MSERWVAVVEAANASGYREGRKIKIRSKSKSGSYEQE
jgi:hypothetical protein